MPGSPAGRRDALLIATGQYDNPELRPLRSPRQDCEGLAAVLGDPAIGDFRVQQHVDATSYEVKRALERFFRQRGREDLLLLHLSCHGIKDDEGHLHFAARDTDKDLPASTAVPAAFLHDQMARCRARTIVVLLDCCYSGAFFPGTKGDDHVHVKEELAGHGRAVLTATSRTEYAWEGDQLQATAPQPSRFTGALIEGLRTGAADADRDGRITVNELYDYAYEHLHRSGARQRPQMWMELEGRVMLARAAGAPTGVSAGSVDGPSGVASGEAGPAAGQPGGWPTPEPVGSWPEDRPAEEAASADAGAAAPRPETPAEQGLFARLKDAWNGVEPEPSLARRPLARRGEDALVSVELPLVETALGTVAELAFESAALCAGCAGRGAAADAPVHVCRLCAGAGTHGRVREGESTAPCSHCDGSGVRIPSPCPDCAGEGRVRVRRTLSVRVPAGVDHGTRIQLAGEGEVGPGGGPRADLYVNVVELPHPELQRHGDDLHQTRSIPRSLARAGGTVEVVTLDGVRSVRVPAGLRPGQTLRLAGYGVRHLRGGGSGDLLIHVELARDDARAEAEDGAGAAAAR
ncbi:DnaJ C-terminal domain-containing protein [Streptomyces sp. NPDC056149]|uniref:caspase, EACC1-associated type n=1 Tax=Streptomyces sp. NPDC056149 TaxID=3345728 RepID=UPI0035D79B29